MKYHTVGESRSKTKITVLSKGSISTSMLEFKIRRWCDKQGIIIWHTTTFLNGQQNERGVYVYFEDEIDAMAFKLGFV